MPPAPLLVQVFVFDDRLGKREGRELEKVLAFFPHTAPPNAMAASVARSAGTL
jgi:hypothetical protein